MVKKVDHKKLLKEPNEFLSFSGRAVRWGKDNSRLLILVGSAAIVVLGSVLSIQGYLSYRNSTAVKALAQVFPHYQATLAEQASPEQTATAREGLEKVGLYYGATPSGQQARLALANLLLQLDDYDKATKVFHGLADDADLPTLLLPLALKGMGQALEGNKKYTEAAEAYAAAAKAGGPILANSLGLDQARALEGAGEREAAIEIYRWLAEESKDKGLAFIAKLRLAHLGVSLDAAPEVPRAKPIGADK
jgi:predicted negative regulator of RcsB-dependent stress response